MADTEYGEHIARQLAAIMKPTWDDIGAKLDAVLLHCEENKGKLLLIEQHHKTCPSAQEAKEDAQ
jgi:hypothetical protein